MSNELAAAQIATRTGFVAALDQSGGSTRAALLHYGTADDVASDPSRMFDAIHAMRSRILRHRDLTGEKVFAAILFDRTAADTVDGVPTPTFLARRGVLPVLKIDRGLEPLRDGVRLMAPIEDLDATLARALSLGIVGTKARSVIASPIATGIYAVVDQQFELAERVADVGLLPILEPEILIDSEGRERSEDMLCSAVLERLDRPAQDYQVAIKLTLPKTPDLYRRIVKHPRVAKVLALSGGYSRAEACQHLAENHGVCASFSRALIEDLRTDMSDDLFAATLGIAVNASYQASTIKR